MTISEMSSLTAFLVSLLLLLPILSHASTSIMPKGAPNCFHSCGIHNISHPFRLKDSPDHCGDMRYNLSCEDNQLVMYWKSGQYYVQSINYNNYTIRLVDANILHHDYSSLLPYSLTSTNFSLGHEEYEDHLYIPSECNCLKIFFSVAWTWEGMQKPDRSTKLMIYLRCPYPVHSSDGTTTASCMKNSSSYGKGSVFHVNVNHKSLWEIGLGDSCRIEFMYPTSWPAEYYNQSNISCRDIHSMLLYGFELSWLKSLCPHLSYYVWLNQHNNPCCFPGWLITGPTTSTLLGNLISLRFLATLFFGTPLVIIVSTYKWRRRHLSMYDAIEDFLRSDNNIMPIRYAHKDIKKMTAGFKKKIGKGGYGSVFKGQLQSGRLVAVKVLDKAKADWKEFINEVATIGNIHHVNVVQLVGFCVEGSKRALIYEFMPNGSLEKYIFSHEDTSSLSCEKLYAISLGIARGIEYLHNGCNMKILHFDIKPHNILLDENFNPKVSDFGLARTCPIDNNTVSLTAARGTIGYMAPELFYRNVGTISFKADVYSFGMLLMEMACRRKNLNALDEHSSQIYYPFWVYDQLHDGKEITVANDTDEEMRLAKKMMIVALWCIQTRPNDRPSMDKVLEMLEEDEELQMPSKPYLYPHDVPSENVRVYTSSVASSDISLSEIRCLATELATEI